MKRVCVLGNSHLAAVKLGWDQRAAAHPDLHCDFFGAPKNGLAKVVFEDGFIIPQTEEVRRAFTMTSGGQEKVQLEDYDVFVTVALGFAMQAIVSQVYRRFRSDAHENLSGDFTLVSEAVFRASCTKALERSTAMWLAKQLMASGKRVLIVPQPLPSERTLTLEDAFPNAALWREAAQYGDDVALLGSLVTATQDLASDGLHFAMQPDETRAGQLFTREIYSRGSVALLRPLGGAHGEQDVGHMNGVYGAVVMTQLAKLLGCEG